MKHDVHHPIIVLDGPDMVGKTTLGKRLVKDLDAHYMHLTYKFRDRMNLYHYNAFMRAVELSKTKPVILDRWWMSEITYAATFRNGSPWSMCARQFDKIGLAHGVTYVLCLPDDKESYQRFHEINREKRYAEKPWALRGRDKEKDIQNISKIYDVYSDLYKWCNGPNRSDIIRYDMFKYFVDIEAAGNFAQSVIEQASDNSVHMSLDDYDFIKDKMYSGNPINPDVLFVINRQSSDDKGRPLYPITGSDKSLWFSSMFEIMSVNEDRVGCLCLHDKDKNQIGYEDVIRTINPKSIVSLDTNSNIDLRNSGIIYLEQIHGESSERFLNRVISFEKTTTKQENMGYVRKSLKISGYR